MARNRAPGPQQAQCPLWVMSGHVQCKTPCPVYPRKRTFAIHSIASRRECGYRRHRVKGSVTRWCFADPCWQSAPQGGSRRRKNAILRMYSEGRTPWASHCEPQLLSSQPLLSHYRVLRTRTIASARPEVSIGTVDTFAGARGLRSLVCPTFILAAAIATTTDEYAYGAYCSTNQPPKQKERLAAVFPNSNQV